MGAMRRLIAFANVLAGLLLAGCVSVGNSNLADQATLAQIKVGETTRQQIEALLGEPSEQRRTEQAGYAQEWWAYSYSTSTINPFEYLLLYGFLTNGLGLFDVRHDLHVFFDLNGRVRSVTMQTTSYDMGSPFRPIHVSSTATSTMTFGGRSGKPVGFTDKMEFRY